MYITLSQCNKAIPIEGQHSTSLIFNENGTACLKTSDSTNGKGVFSRELEPWQWSLKYTIDGRCEFLVDSTIINKKPKK